MNALTQDIVRTEKNILSLLRGNRVATQQFKAILSRYKSDRAQAIRDQTLGATPAPADTTPWYESNFFTNLVNFGKSTYTTGQASKADQAKLNIQLQQLQAQNANLDKQMVVAQQVKQSTYSSGSILKSIENKPWALPALGGLIFLFIFNRKKRNRGR